MRKAARADPEKSAARSRLAAACIVIAAALLAGCATLEAPSSGRASTLLVGRVTLDASGVGWAENGAEGLLNADYTIGAVMAIANVTDGTRYEAKTLTPGFLFTVPNIRPGQYKVLEFSCQVQSFNAPINLDTKLGEGAVFEVKEGQITNLGVILWRVDFDLSSSLTKATFAQVKGGDAIVGQAFSRSYADSPWLSYPSESVVISGNVKNTSDASPMEPKILPNLYMW